MLKKNRQRRSRLIEILNVPSEGTPPVSIRLRPCWTVFLSILQECSVIIPDIQIIDVLLWRNCFSVGC
jgi:hypothetical protein